MERQDLTGRVRTPLLLVEMGLEAAVVVVMVEVALVLLVLEGVVVMAEQHRIRLLEEPVEPERAAEQDHMAAAGVVLPEVTPHTLGEWAAQELISMPRMAAAGVVAVAGITPAAATAVMVEIMGQVVEVADIYPGLVALALMASSPSSIRRAAVAARLWRQDAHFWE